MATRISPPVFGNGKNYERYKQELLAWKEITDLGREKQAIAVALTLPENDESQIREKVFDQLELDELKSHDGFKCLIRFLDKHLAKDDLTDSLDKFEDFEDFKRADEQSINEFVATFDSMYRKIDKKNMKLPAEILAFKLLRKANISKEERMLVLTGMNYENKKTLYEEAKRSLKKFKGSEIKSFNKQETIKLDSAFLEANEEALLAAGYSKSWGGYRDNYRADRGRGWKQGSPEKFNVRENQGGEFVGEKRRLVKPINPMGPEGKLLTCKSCGSFRHLLPVCPDSWENMKRAHTVEEQHTVLFTGYDTNEMRRLGVNARNCAILDSACSSTVCGSTWMDNYIKSLALTVREKVMQSEGHRMFKFGGGTCLKSKGEFRIPAVVAGKNVTIKTDVVDSDIPLLLSRTAMKKAAIKMDLENDTATIMGQEVALNITESGHCCIPIDKTAEVHVEHMFADNHESANTQDIKIPKTLKIPNVKSNNLLVLREQTNGELIENQGIFTHREANEGVGRKLRAKVSVSEQGFEHEDSTFYKMAGLKCWLGQGKVDFRDRKEVFVRDEAVSDGISPNRLQKVPDLLDSRDNHISKNTTDTSKAIAQPQMNDTSNQSYLSEEAPARHFHAGLQKVLEEKPMVGLVDDIQTEYCGKNTLSTRWIITTDNKQMKSRLDVCGFEEEFVIQRDSLTVEKEVSTSNSTNIVVKSQEINKDVYPSKECEDDKRVVRKLHYRFYRPLNDGTRMLHLRLNENMLRDVKQIWILK